MGNWEFIAKEQDGWSQRMENTKRKTSGIRGL